MLLQSGRYFDTVGWMSTTLPQNDKDASLKMTRRHLDNNIQTYKVSDSSIFSSTP